VRSRSFPAPAVFPVVRFSSEVTLAPLFQMRSLETISMARRNGRGPDISLTSPWTFVCTRRSLTDSHSLCTQKSSFTCHGGQLCGQRNPIFRKTVLRFSTRYIVLGPSTLHPRIHPVFLAFCSVVYIPVANYTSAIGSAIRSTR